MREAIHQPPKKVWRLVAYAPPQVTDLPIRPASSRANTSVPAVNRRPGSSPICALIIPDRPSMVVVADAAVRYRRLSKPVPW